MAGTINFAMTQQFDMDGRPLSGGLLYFFVAGTTTPQNAFQDVALTIAWPNPIVLDASGRVPMFYLADGFIKIRLTTEGGVTVIAADQLLVIGPSSGGGGGGGTVDPTSVVATGDIKTRFGTGTLDGFVRCNGNTIGNAVSGATERANADCQALFEYLWSTTVLGVFAGATPARGASANADWVANKRIALPDLRGRVVAGMDDMGAAAVNRLTAAGLGVVGTVLGNAGGLQTSTLSAANMASHTHTQQGSFTTATENAAHNHNFSWAGTTGDTNQSLDHTHGYTDSFFSGANGTAAGGNPPGGTNQSQSLTTGTASFGIGSHNHSYSGTSVTNSENQAHAHTFSISGETAANAGGASSPFVNVPPTMVMTVYIKL